MCMQSFCRKAGPISTLLLTKRMRFPRWNDMKNPIGRPVGECMIDKTMNLLSGDVEILREFPILVEIP
jgi:hypothetical protein